MSVRKSIGRVSITPSGQDFDIVLKKAKSYFKNTSFEMQQHDFGNGAFWSSTSVTVLPFISPVGTIIIKRLERGWKIEE